MIIVVIRLTFLAQVTDMRFDIHTVNPYIRKAIPSVLSAGTEIRRRVIFDYELIYVERGTFTLMYAQREYRCEPGQFLLLRPGVPHRLFEIREDVSQPHVHFDLFYTAESPRIPISFKDMEDLSAEERGMVAEDVFGDYPQEPFVRFADPEGALALFYGIIGDSAPLKQKAGLLRLIEMLVENNFPDCFARDSGYSLAQQLKDYIDAGQGLSDRLCDLEKQFSYSKYYLERQFREKYGISLIAYRNERRLRQARKLLRTGTVSDTAEQLGYGSIYAFSRAFKQAFGISPTQWQKRE